MKKRNQIILFGAGAISKLLTDNVNENTEIIGYIAGEADSNSFSMNILSLNEINSYEYDYVVVAFGNVQKGVEILRDNGVPSEKIVGYAYSGIDYNSGFLQAKCDQYLHEITRNEKIPLLFNLPVKRYYVCGMNILEAQDVISRDFVREQTLAFLAEEIERRNIKGCVAEIGVSSGEFAQKINLLFPERKLYLFDTFSGLPKNDKEKALNMGWGERYYAMNEKGTHPDEVLEHMPNKKMCVIKKGIFPDTFDIDDSIAFASLDIDFYDSIKRGLEIIYPKLSKGGYIMVHDFHNLSYTESRDAIIDFCTENEVGYVPIPDNGGTAVLVK